MLCATRCAECRSAEASTMRARSTCLRGRLRSTVIAANCSRSSALKTTHTWCAMAPIPQTMADITHPDNAMAAATHHGRAHRGRRRHRAGNHRS
jgi:hypothetical protein